MVNPVEIEERAQAAVRLFSMGYNCSQAVFAACADMYGLYDKEVALRVSASFGGGIGRMHKTCGAACGMFMLEGLNTGNAIPNNPAGKMQNYARVQMLAGDFRKKFGSTTCATLLAGIGGGAAGDNMRKHKCSDMVAEAVRIALSHK